jgi:valyl-tRNA synthetase
VLHYVFESALRLLHPFMPFVSEELWQNLPHEGESIVVAAYPQPSAELEDARAETQVEMIQDVIIKVRNVRSEMNVDPKQAVTVRIAATDPAVAGLLTEAREYIFRLASVGTLDVVAQLSGDKLAAQAVAAGCALEIPLAGLIDRDAELGRLRKELDRADKEIVGLDRKLSNSSFVERAPAEVVDENRKRLAAYQDQAGKLRAAIERLQ